MFRHLQQFAGPAILIALVIWMFHRTLFSGGHLLPSFPNADLHTEFLEWRNFGFTQWLTGHFPWWNPHVFCGIPFFAQMQSCMLYPIAWINLFCKTATATCIEFAADVAAAAICMYAWSRQRSVSRCGAILAGAAYAFSGSTFFGVLAGHLTPQATLAWIPLVFLALDRLLNQRYSSGIVIGAIAVCLQWLGGHPQLVYYTMLVGGAYVFIQSIGRPQILRIIPAGLLMFALGSALAAVQVWPAVLASELTLRSGKMAYEFASSFSFAPQSLLTIFIPYPFGDMVHLPYAGPWYMWEMSAYVGIVDLALATVAIINMRAGPRWRTLAILALVMLLMSGANTPLYPWLYQYLPGFADFRGVAKFSMFWALLISLLAGQGFDLVRMRSLPRQAIAFFFFAFLCFFAGALFLHFNSTGGWAAHLFASVIRGATTFTSFKDLYRPHLAQSVAPWIASQWFIAGALLIAPASIMFLRRPKSAAYLLLIIAIGDIYLFAMASSPIAAVSIPFRSDWMHALDQSKLLNTRVLFLNSYAYGNTSEILDFNSIWGYDPAQPRAFSELIAASEHRLLLPNHEFVPRFNDFSPVFELLRVSHVLQERGTPVIDIPIPLPQLQLVGDYQLIHDSKAAADLLVGQFPYRGSAILDTAPNPAPTETGADGHIVLVRQSINDLEIIADLPAPALLLITDAYAPGWRARSLEPHPPQNQYTVLRADDVLRAIPLAGGHHHLDIYYTVPGLTLGTIISSVAACLILVLITLRLRLRWR